MIRRFLAQRELARIVKATRESEEIRTFRKYRAAALKGRRKKTGRSA